MNDNTKIFDAVIQDVMQHELTDNMMVRLIIKVIQELESTGFVDFERSKHQDHELVQQALDKLKEM